jgi:hypothetical protein
MRPLPYFAALTLAACTGQNPLFGLATETGSSSAAPTGSTATPTGDGPTSNSPTAATSTSADATSSADTTSAVSMSGTTDRPATTTAVDPNTTTGQTDDGTTTTTTTTGDPASTGEMACLLQVSPTFNDHLQMGGEPYASCNSNPTFFHGRLMAGGNELRFNTSNTGCVGEEKLGPLSLGTHYDLPVANDSPCAKLFVYRDGDAPECDIAQFIVVIPTDPPETIAVGYFTPTNPIVNRNITFKPEAKLLPCCPEESQECCDDGMFGDFKLTVDGEDVFPGETAPVQFDGKPGRLANIQNWQTGDCLNNAVLARHDWIGIRP